MARRGTTTAIAASLVSSLVGIVGGDAAVAGPVLDAVKARGALICGVQQAVDPGRPAVCATNSLIGAGRQLQAADSFLH